jgi:hypothetical protein
VSSLANLATRQAENADEAPDRFGFRAPAPDSVGLTGAERNFAIFGWGISVSFHRYGFPLATVVR